MAMATTRWVVLSTSAVKMKVVSNAATVVKDASWTSTDTTRDATVWMTAATVSMLWKACATSEASERDARCKVVVMVKRDLAEVTVKRDLAVVTVKKDSALDTVRKDLVVVSVKKDSALDTVRKDLVVFSVKKDLAVSITEETTSTTVSITLVAPSTEITAQLICSMRRDKVALQELSATRSSVTDTRISQVMPHTMDVDHTT